MKKQILIGSGTLSVLVALGLAAQDKSSVKVPDGLAFSEFRGYEDWKVVAPSQTDAENVMRVIVANPVMMKAYREGFRPMVRLFPMAPRWRRSNGNRERLRRLLFP
jgi:hypothetical protein